MKKRINIIGRWVLAILMGITVPCLQAAVDAVASETDKMAWWDDAKFGMFLTWGPYAVLGGEYNGHRQANRNAEWIMNRCKIPVDEYRNIASQFNPVQFDARAIVRLAKDSGMKYIMIMPKHHDGFAMFKSDASDYNIVDFTPYRKDVVDQLVNACRSEGMKFGFYYSQAQDWGHPGGAVARKLTREGWPNPRAGEIDEYTRQHRGAWDPWQTTATFGEYLRRVAVPQVRELLTRYPDVSVIFWDTPIHMGTKETRLFRDVMKDYPMIIQNDRLGAGAKGDYKTPEAMIPERSQVDGLYWETCDMIGSSWGYKRFEDSWKTPETLIRNLATIVSRGGNLLLNVGPDGDGAVPEENITRLKAIGDWMKTNSEAIYGTMPSPVGEFPWGVCTARNAGGTSCLYLIVFEWPSGGLLSVPMAYGVRTAKLLGGQAALSFDKTDRGIEIKLPAQEVDRGIRVIKLELTEQLPETRKKTSSRHIFDAVEQPQ